MMNVLICVTEYYPDGSGIANVAYNVAENLKKMGVKCTICSPTGPDIKLGNLNLIKKFGIIGLLYYWYQVSLFFKSNSYDIAWLHNPLFIRKNPFNKYFTTMHVTLNGVYETKVSRALFFHCYKYISAKIEKYSLKKLDPKSNFSCVSTTVKNELIKLGVPVTQIEIIANGVNTTHFCPAFDKKILRKKLSLPENAIIILFVGRLTPAKQPRVLIELFSLLEKEFCEVYLYIAGDGELFDAVKKETKKIGTKKICFLGKLNYYDEIPSFYSCADYYIITSKYEGLPLTLLEAMSSGLPCIVSDIPNLKIVKKADCGIIVDYSDIPSALNQVLNYIKNPDINHSTNARNFIIKNYDWLNISEKYYFRFSQIIHE